MKILGIETSCDETAASIVENGTTILSNIVASSSDIHTKTGGIIPEEAARQQIVSIIPVVNQALVEAFGNNDPSTIDAIGVTYGPGLIGSLLVGVETAKTLSFLWKKPIIPVNHLVGHIYANWLSGPKEPKPEFPALALVVSGGHTDLVLMLGHGKFEWIGGTRDDAAGEAFDKTARLMGLPYPGGPSISKAADQYFNSKSSRSNKVLNKFPRPMIGKDNFDWSFSGLKTAVLREFENVSNKHNQVGHFSAEVQEAIVDVLVQKTLKAVNKFKPKSLLLAGGVVANSRLRNKFSDEIGDQTENIDLFVPPPKLCTDNAAYIAGCAFFIKKATNWDRLASNPQLSIMGTS